MHMLPPRVRLACGGHLRGRFPRAAAAAATACAWARVRWDAAAGALSLGAGGGRRQQVLGERLHAVEVAAAEGTAACSCARAA